MFERFTRCARGLMLALIVTPLAAAQTNNQPLTWPQKFAVQGPEVKSFGFAVTQPGPIGVDLQVQGPPVVVSLQGAAQPIQQQGVGALHLAYVASPQDVQRGLFWSVRIRLAQGSPQARASATGTISIQYPPADQAQVQRAASALAASAQARRAQARAASEQNAAQFAKQLDASLQEQRAQLEQLRAQRHAALMAQHQPMIDRLRGGAGSAIVTRGVDTGNTDASQPQLTTRSIPAGTFKVMTGTPNPAVKSLSVGQGEPGDPVMINGTAFGTAAGEVHFVIAPGMDLVPKGVIWTDTQIFATVPGPANGGVAAFNGTVYVKRADQVVSNLLPFAFTPQLERRMISMPAVPNDSILPRYPDDNLFVMFGALTRGNCNWLWNPSGDDQLFPNTVLKNGWKVYAPPTVYAPYSLGFGGGAYLVDSRVGTNSPYVDIHWWVDVGCNGFGYSVVMYIQGPLGTPDGVAVP